MKILRRFPRWFNRLYARALAYFWIPCPICGLDFGGHELGHQFLIDPKTTTLILLDDGHNGWYWNPGHAQHVSCWRCDNYVGEENAKHALAILGPERYQEAFKDTLDAHHRRTIEALGVSNLIVGKVDDE